MISPKVKNFHDRQFITAYVEPAYAWDKDKSPKYTVNWSAIGSVSAEEGRNFAAALIEACDWLDAQKAGSDDTAAA